jgi:ABC-type Fe3+/spermidine/putrescine transport system ATPase subunit
MIQLENFLYIPANSTQFKLSVDALIIPKGSKFFVIGPSGSGKTTLLKALSGLLSNCAGKLYIDGDLISTPNLSKRDVMYLSQELGLWPHLTCMEHISFVTTRGKSLRDDLAIHWLKRVGLGKKIDIRPNHLSGGEQKRLALARVMAAEPKYLFLDEPFANLDLVLAQELMTMIDQEQTTNKFSLIKVTHHGLGINNNGVTLLVVNQGRIVQQGSLQQIVENPIDDWTAKWVKLVA